MKNYQDQVNEMLLEAVENLPKSQKVLFTVSNDGGKTGIFTTDDVYEALDYCDYYNGTSDYCVVAVKVS